MLPALQEEACAQAPLYRAGALRAAIVLQTVHMLVSALKKLPAPQPQVSGLVVRIDVPDMHEVHSASLKVLPGQVDADELQAHASVGQGWGEPGKGRQEAHGDGGHDCMQLSMQTKHVTARMCVVPWPGVLHEQKKHTRVL